MTTMNRYQVLAMKRRFVSARTRRIAAEIPFYRQEQRLRRMVLDWAPIYAELAEAEAVRLEIES